MCRDNSNGNSDHHKKDCCCCRGEQGPQGVPGMQGQQGMQGVTGQDGAPGPKGDAGAMGAQGPKGDAGAMGPQGLMGPLGPMGPMGQAGAQGLQGLAGPQGPAGANGQNGAAGPQGPQGLLGPQGPQGLQGVPGKDCPEKEDCCCPRWFSIYSSLPAVVTAHATPGDAVLFDKVSNESLGDFDLTNAPALGEMKFLKHGIYELSWLLQARILPPINVPVPSWSFGFWLNGLLVGGSVYSGYTQAPGDDAAHSTGGLIIEVKAGDILKIRNTCVSDVTLNPVITGSIFPITIATVVAKCLKALP